MVPPGAAEAPPSLLVTERSGAPVTGVVSLPELLPGVGSVPLVPSSAIVAVLAICVTPAGSGLVTVTANVALPPPAAATEPTASVQVEPALLFGAQTQPPVLAPALNVVFAGTVSVSTTPVAPRLPVLEYVSVKATVPPGATEEPPSLLVTERSGAPVTGVVSLPELLPGVGSVPLVPSSATVAVLAICVTPAASGLITVTAKVAEPPPAAATPPTASVQVEPALLLGAQTQPAVLAPALNVVFAGTVSVSTTPAAPRLPVLA